MLSFPNAKINLGLRVLRKRDDGYHDLDTVFYPLPLCDALEAVQVGGNGGIGFSSSGLAIAGEQNNNLCIKAWQLLKKDFPGLPAVKMHLHKIIPMGAGLGGGSSDGAFALQLVDKLCGLKLPQAQLMRYALELGSDCPFFMLNRTCHAGSRGELLEPIALDISAYQLAVVHPGIHVSTAQAFAGITPAVPVQSVAEIVARPVKEWKAHLVNDFEKTVIAHHPEIGRIKEMLYDKGAVYASMTGSGSAVYGLFDRGRLPALSEYPTYRVHYTK